MPRILNIDIDNLRFDDFLQKLTSGVVFTPNVDHVMKMQKDRDLYDMYQQADYRVCDSRIIQLVSAWATGEKIIDQIAGSDFFPAFCYHHRDNTAQIRVFLLGGTPDSVRQAQNKINERAGSQVAVGGYSPPFGFEHDPEETEKIIEKITHSGATVLAVGVGAPKQEKWIMTHKDQLPAIKIFLGIGATIDFIAGHRKRAAPWVSRMGLEWAFRLMQEPGRMFRRYLIENLPFFWLILKQKVGRYQNPWTKDLPSPS
ncbi:MAG: WecB/TagA/CpsF family glycosyltransferase [Bacteroidota bacterium]